MLDRKSARLCYNTECLGVIDGNWEIRNEPSGDPGLHGMDLPQVPAALGHWLETAHGVWLQWSPEAPLCSQIPFSGPSPCQGRDGTNIDNEIFGTSVLGEDPVPTGSPPCPERGQMGSQLLVRTETTGHPPCSRLRGPGCAGTAQTCRSGLRSWLPLCRPLPPTPACW